MSCLEGEGSFGPKDMSLGFGQSQEMLVVCSVFYIYHLSFIFLETPAKKKLS